VFHAITGETCALAVRWVRLCRAEKMLVQTDLPLAQIALDIGQSGVASFSRAVTTAFGQ
jgi:AraC family transcriptional regulator